MDFFRGQALAASTKKTYSSAKRRYLKFCACYNIVPIPINEHSMCRYVAFLAEEGVSPGSIHCYLSAVRHLHIEGGWGDPAISQMPKLELVIRGVKRARGKSGQPKPRLPITPDLLKKLRGAWLERSASPDDCMLWAAASLCFFGFFRAGEITIPSDSAFDSTRHLSFADVSVDNLTTPSMLKIHLKCSKTDPFGKGVDVIVGKTSNNLCPIRAVLDYLMARGPGAGPLFCFQNGKPLTRVRFVDQVRDALSKVGIDCRPYSGHSFRSGAATAAARIGVQDSTIKMLGRWRSDAFQLYIKMPRHHLAAVAGKLVEAINPQPDEKSEGGLLRK